MRARPIMHVAGYQVPDRMRIETLVFTLMPLFFLEESEKHSICLIVLIGWKSLDDRVRVTGVATE